MGAGGVKRIDLGAAVEDLPILVQRPDITFLTPTLAQEMAPVRELFEEYAQSLSVDLAFQGFEEELAQLPGRYGPPRGCIVLAYIEGRAAGCCALAALDNCDYPNAAEMKRLFVRKAFRGFGLGRLLTEAILTHAQRMGYSAVLLDTLDDMETARALYADVGFVEIPPYYHNPIPGAHYLKVDIG